MADLLAPHGQTQGITTASSRSWKGQIEAARTASEAREKKGSWHQFSYSSLDNSLVGATLGRWTVKDRGARVREGEALDSLVVRELAGGALVVTEAAPSEGAARLRIAAPLECQGGWVSRKCLRPQPA